MEIDAHFSAAALVMAIPVVAYLIAGEPWLGRRMYADLARDRETKPTALARFYGVSLAVWGTLAALTAVVVLVAPGVRAADLGLAAPEDPFLTAIVAATFGAAMVGATRALRRTAREGRNVPGQAAIAALLPRTAPERRLALAVAVTDGIAGEILYRGLLIAFGVGVLGLNTYLAAALALLVYAAAGIYQGGRGVVIFGLFGLLCTMCYLATESLVLPMVIHTLVSVRDLLLVPRSMDTDPQPAGRV